MKPLVVTRPEPGATATMTAARALGIKAVPLPLFEVVAVPWAIPHPTNYDALLVTSANAVRHAGKGLRALSELPVAAVGEATAAAARAAGFQLMTTGAAGVDALLAELPADLRLLHLAGYDRTRLPPGRAIDTVVVYRSLPTDPNKFEQVAGAVVSLHSARAAARLAGLVDEHGLGRGSIELLTLSDGVAREAGEGWQRVTVAPQPSDAALLALARTLCL